MNIKLGDMIESYSKVTKSIKHLLVLSIEYENNNYTIINALVISNVEYRYNCYCVSDNGKYFNHKVLYNVFNLQRNN